MKRKSILIACILLVAICICGMGRASIAGEKLRYPYGVFIGMDKLDVKRLGKYDVVVIDGEYFSKKQISKLKKAGCKQIYSYFNVGSLEDFREYYGDYKDITLKEYENWPGEYWVDVSNADWQKFCVNRAEKLRKKGIDGFFVDNCDVYYQFEREEIYQGLRKILKQLHKKGKVIINGGDTFVSQCIKQKQAGVFDGVNQESVYTSIDFDKNRFGKAKTEERKYFTDYLKEVKKAKKAVYVLEYASNSKIAKASKTYAKKNGWEIYVSSTLELK